MKRRMRWLAFLFLTNLCIAGGQYSQRVISEPRETYPTGGFPCEQIGVGC